MKMTYLLPKIKDKLHREMVLNRYDKETYGKYCKRYCSYRNLNNKNSIGKNAVKQYLTARPNPNAGIGHQMANINAGIWFAKIFGLDYAYLPFTSDFVPFSKNMWDTVLGYGENLIKVEYLVKQKGYKEVLLPKFNELSNDEMNIIRSIIASYSGEKVVFRLEQDQYYGEQIGVREDIQRLYYSASARENDKIIFNKNNINIAVHIRRQVKINDKVIAESEEIQKKRWTGNEYYIEILKNISNALPKNKEIDIYIFSTASEDEFRDFKMFGNVKICNELDEYQSFINLVNADILLTSKSSFSYKAAMLSKGIIISPEGFWHKYPENDTWFTADSGGRVERVMQLNNTLQGL